jgi:hypothetical protein
MGTVYNMMWQSRFSLDLNQAHLNKQEHHEQFTTNRLTFRGDMLFCLFERYMSLTSQIDKKLLFIYA